MPIIETSTWLKQFYHEMELSSHPEDKVIPSFKRLMDHYPSWDKSRWIQLLYENGMLTASKRAKERWGSWTRKGPYREDLTLLFKELKKDFSGPDLDIFLLPIDVDNEYLMETMNKKNGITFPTMILLFFHESLTKKEKEALLIHEYHHASRLFHQKNNEMNITLLESMVMEGLAEFEVGRRLGKEYVSPWMSLYKEEELLQWWDRSVKSKRYLRGRRHHLSYIYGGSYGIPKWLGYNIGYSLVESFINSDKSSHLPIQLLKMDNETIYQTSIFNKAR